MQPVPGSGPWPPGELQQVSTGFPSVHGAGSRVSAGTGSRPSCVPLAGVTGKPGISQPQGRVDSLILCCHLISTALSFSWEYGFWQCICCHLSQAHSHLAPGRGDIKPSLLNKRGPCAAVTEHWLEAKPKLVLLVLNQWCCCRWCW